MYKIAIDGPSASGKTEVAKLLAWKLNILAVDTGAIYRAVAFHCDIEGIDITCESAVISELNKIDIKLERDNVYLNGIDVSDGIRTAKISKITPVIAQIVPVREFVLKIQRKIANTKSVVMQGRDITSVVLPDAEIKIYLDATVEERAMRRKIELESKGEKHSLAEVLENIEVRDKKDMERVVSPLVRVPDAIYIDSTFLAVEQVVDKIILEVNKRGLR